MKVDPSAIQDAKYGVLKVDRNKLLEAYKKMNNRHAMNHSNDKNYKIGKQDNRLNNSGLARGMR